MREIDPAATEFGPEGFLPTEPEAMADVLARHQLHAIDGFTLLLLHRPDHDPQRHVIEVLERNATTGAAHVGALRRQRLAGYDTRPTLDDEAWVTLDRIDAVAAKHHVRAVLHPHVGSMIENGDEVQRLVEGSSIPVPGHRSPAHRRAPIPPN